MLPRVFAFLFIALTVGAPFAEAVAQSLDQQSCRNMAQDAYIAYYGRPADGDGRDYWAQRICDDGGWSESLIDAFGTSPEYEQVFSDKSPGELLDAFYLRLFGRPPDEAGRQWYLDRLAAGQTTLPRIALDILNGAQNEDLTVVRLRRQAADYFTLNQPYSGLAYDLGNRDAIASIMVSAVDEASLAESQQQFRELLEGRFPPPPSSTRILDPWDAHDMRLEGSMLSYAPVSPEARNVQAGDLVITNPFFGDAGGLARIVDSVMDDGLYKVLATTDIGMERALGEALENGLVQSIAPLGYDELQSAETAPGVVIGRDAPVVLDRGEDQDPLQVYPIRVDFDVDLEDAGVSGSLNGSVSILPQALFKLDMLSGEVNDSSLAVRIARSDRLAVHAIGGATLVWETELVALDFRPVAFRVGGVPVYAVPRLKISAAASGTLSGTASFGMQQTGFDRRLGSSVDAAGTATPVSPQAVEAIISPGGLTVTSAYDLEVALDTAGEIDIYQHPGLDFGTRDALRGAAEFAAEGDTCVDLTASSTVESTLFAAGLDRMPLDFRHTDQADELYVDRFCGSVNSAFVIGSVIDAVTGDPLGDVEIVVLASAGVEIARGLSGADGLFSFSVPSGFDLHALMLAPGFLDDSFHLGSFPNGESTTIERVRKIPDTAAGPGALVGQVIDATNGRGISGAEVLLRPGINAYSGDVTVRTTADGDGLYRFDNVEAGNYTVQGASRGFADGFATANLIGGNENSADVTITPHLPAGQWRTILTWGEEPADLDSHLTGPSSAGGRFHVYYEARTSEGADLDVDDVTSFGPETITIREQLAGVYRYLIHDFSNRDSDSSSALARSGARVEVYNGNDRVGLYSVPSAPGTVWAVFEIEDNQISSINEMSYESNPADVGALDF